MGKQRDSGQGPRPSLGQLFSEPGWLGEIRATLWAPRTSQPRPASCVGQTQVAFTPQGGGLFQAFFGCPTRNCTFFSLPNLHGDQVLQEQPGRVCEPVPRLAGDQPRGGAVTLSLPSVGIIGEGGGARARELTEDWEPEGAGRLGKEIKAPKIDS